MTYLSEDPTFLAGGLVLLAGAFLVALKVTEQGKYLIHAGISLALAVAVVVIERAWVTDNERIAQVVYDLARAVKNSDADRVLAHLTPTVQYTQEETALSEDMTRALIRSNLNNARFDFVRISDLQTSSGQQTRRGTADFRVLASGSLNSSHGTIGSGVRITAWSLGFQETSPGVWKVNRITPVSIPQGILASPDGDRSERGFNRNAGFPQLGPRSKRGGRPIQKLRGLLESNQKK